MKKRVLLGMSGGVDSSVAGYLLREQGYDVVGVTMKVWPQDCISRAEDKCCGPQAVADARSVAHSLGIPHYVVDEADQFERLVIDYFSSEYQAGRTPNPCVMCNEKLKFGNLWNKAEALGCDYIATGHYAIIEHHPRSRGSAQRRRSAEGPIVFHVQSAPGAIAARAHAARRNVEAGHPRDRAFVRPESRRQSRQPGNLFRARNDYKAFLRSHLGEKNFIRGGIYDLEGNFLGEHEGIEMFTIGQRKGLPGGSAQPRYVVDIDPETNRVLVGAAEDLVSEDFEIDRVNWMPADRDRRVFRSDGEDSLQPSRHAAPRSRLLDDGRARVQLHEPQKAVTPGQAAVFYDGDVVVGGGWICRAAALSLPERWRTKSFSRSALFPMRKRRGESRERLVEASTRRLREYFPADSFDLSLAGKSRIGRRSPGDLQTDQRPVSRNSRGSCARSIPTTCRKSSRAESIAACRNTCAGWRKLR